MRRCISYWKWWFSICYVSLPEGTWKSVVKKQLPGILPWWMKYKIYTPENWHFEAKHHLIEKENHLPSTSIFGSHVNFPGSIQNSHGLKQGPKWCGVMSVCPRKLFSGVSAEQVACGGCPGQCRVYAKQILGTVVPYCWWLKSCTAWDVWNPINNGKTTYQLVQDFGHQQ